MPREHWISLDYRAQETALATAVGMEEPWDCFDDKTLQEFFESSPSAEQFTRRFVDIRRLRVFFGNPELDDFDNDMGMDSAQYRLFSDRLFHSIGYNLLRSDESAELAMLVSIGAPFVTIHSTWIHAETDYGARQLLRFTRKVFSDGRDDEIVGPFDDEDSHAFIDYQGEWLEFDAESVDPGADSNEYIEEVDEVEIPEEDKDMELSLRWDDGEDGERLIPGYDPSNDTPLGGLGDDLFDDEED